MEKTRCVCYNPFTGCSLPVECAHGVRVVRVQFSAPRQISFLIQLNIIHLMLFAQHFPYQNHTRLYYNNLVEEFARPYQTKPRSFVKKIMTLFIFGTTSFSLLISVGFLLILTTKDATKIPVISPLAGPIAETYAAIKETFAPDLHSTVQNSLDGSDGEFGIVIKNLKTGETYTQNENKSFVSASLYKLWLMGTAYTQFENGKLKPTDFIANNAGSLNSMFGIASESAERSSGNVAMNAQNAIYNAITVSDNYSALLLTSRVTIKELGNFQQSNGMLHSTTDVTPHTTPADIAIFYEKLYNKTLVSTDASEKMLETLKQQKINDRIPKYLPQYIQVAHKTGELDGYKHDAGIVYTPRGDYIFVAMTNSNNPTVAAERIAVLSQRVYAYFTRD